MVIGGLPESEVEAAALEVLSGLGWTWKNTQEETFGEQGDFGRDKEEPFLAIRLKAALAKLNPDLPKDALSDAYEQLTRDRSSLSLVKANQDLYGLLKEGIDFFEAGFADIEKKVGDRVNIEVDILGRYVERLLSQNAKQSSISMEFLSKHGFL